MLSVTYFGGKGLLQRFFFRTGYVYAEETERAEELQEYVTQNKLSASDYKMLKKWGTERNIDDFTISRGKWLLFDISYNGKIMYGSREIPNLTWRMYHRISFKDGTADVYIYEGTADKYFNILMVFSVVLGVAACIGIVVSGMYENVKYIQCLMKEVNIISRGNLQGNVTVQGTDEIAQLASGLEHMRQTLVKKDSLIEAFHDTKGYTDREEAWEHIYNVIQTQREKLLIVIDNAETIGQDPDIERLGDLPCRILVTSRTEKIGGLYRYSVDHLPEEDCRDIFYHYYVGDHDNHYLDKILGLIEHHTVMLELLAKTANMEEKTLQEFYALLVQKGFRISNKNVDSHHPLLKSEKRITEQLKSYLRFQSVVSKIRICCASFP